ncbi:Chondroitin sulfate synthase 1 [Tyrophagus putrescentiae]|nr:Chondroitin sulfate synthase 1 [Tyrophagus putrescentiae]
MACCKTLKRTVHITIGIIIGFLVTSQTFRSLNYENFKRDIIFQLCSYRNSNQNQNIDSAKSNHHDSSSNSTPDQQPSTRRSWIDNKKKQLPGHRELLLIGVMTAQPFLSTRALTIHQTWAAKMGGHLIFFSSGNSTARIEGDPQLSSLPLIALPGVTDAYPPQKKSFLMLKFMADFFGDRYHFFMRADDDVLVNVPALKRFLRRLNSSRPLFLGQTGVGNEAEFGQLALHRHENFCMGGPGVVLSRSTLAKLAAHTSQCLGRLRSSHEDVELGRCVRRTSGVSCTWSYDMGALFYHNASLQQSLLQQSSEEESAFFPAIKELSSALTVHPIKEGGAMRRLYRYLQAVEHQKVRFQLTTAYRRLNYHLSRISTSSEEEEEELLRLLRLQSADQLAELRERAQRLGRDVLSFKDSVSTSDTSTWKFFAAKLYSELSANPKRHLERHLSAAFHGNLPVLMRRLNDLGLRGPQKLGRLLDFHSLYYGYVRFTPETGVQYVLDLLLIYRRFAGKRLTLPIRRHAHAVQSFSEPVVRKWPVEEYFAQGEGEKEEVDHIEVNLVVPLAGRMTTFHRFLANFARVWEADQRLTLTLATEQHHHLPPKVVRVLAMNSSEPFSRGVAFQRSLALFADHQLLFFLDVDMTFTGEVLRRVRRNAIRRRQVYFPIVFSQYGNEVSQTEDQDNRTEPSDHLPTINDLDGYWRQFGFGIVALYRSDLLAVGGYETTIHGWGMEDVALYDRFVSSPNHYTIFRAVDPGLVHVYHPITCDRHLSALQYEMCLGTKLSSLDSTAELAAFIHRHRLL